MFVVWCYYVFYGRNFKYKEDMNINGWMYVEILECGV